MFYDFIMGDKKVKYCEECGERLIRVTTGNKMYCKKCKYKIKKIQDRIADKKYKNKKRET